MFRYVALAWESAASASQQAAQAMSSALLRNDDWTLVFSTEGLRVLAAGIIPGINDVHAIGEHGVLLGKAFSSRTFNSNHIEADKLFHRAGIGHAESSAAQLVQEYWGRYVAFLKEGAQSWVLRDPTGSLPCHVTSSEGVQIVFSWSEDVIDFSRRLSSPVIDWSFISHQLHYGDLGGSRTAIEGVSDVLPGEIVSLSAEAPKRHLLWDVLKFARSPGTEDVATAAASLHTVVRECARAWSRSYDKVLFRLSGGLDSAILLGQISGDPTSCERICLNYYSVGPDTDERYYARLAAARAGDELIELEHDFSYPLENVLRVARMPTPNSYLGRIGTARADARLASEHGAEAMFTGGGGDQLFFELRHWWPAADYLSAHGLGRGALKAALDSARLAQVSVWQVLREAWKARHPVHSPEGPLPFATSLLCPDGKSPPERVLHYAHPSFQRINSLPIGKLAHVRMIMSMCGYYDPFERERAPELVNPLLSQPLIEFALRLPTYTLTCGGHARGLARIAFAAELPVEIATRRSKGSTGDYIERMLHRHISLARDLLLDGELSRRGIVDRRRLEEALSSRPTAMNTCATEVHTLIGIEAWARSWSCAPPYTSH